MAQLFGVNVPAISKHMKNIYSKGELTELLDSIKGKLIVSCQARPGEPLRDSKIMGAMALSAKWGGASAIRANTVPDVLAIKESTGLPILGIIKRDYDDSEVYITPTMKEVDELVEKLAGCMSGQEENSYYR